MRGGDLHRFICALTKPTRRLYEMRLCGFLAYNNTYIYNKNERMHAVMLTRVHAQFRGVQWRPRGQLRAAEGVCPRGCSCHSLACGFRDGFPVAQYFSEHPWGNCVSHAWRKGQVQGTLYASRTKVEFAVET